MDIAEPETGTLAPGAEVATGNSDRYRLLNTLGAGGMGIVYLAEDLKLHRQVAIKKLRDDVTSPSARDRIQQEARLLARLNHPNIVALYDVLDGSQDGENGNIALVMEYIEGTTLRAWMREHTPNLQQKLQLLMQICEGLQQAHNLGIIHRDLKPDNILIATSRNGHVTAKISDFGIAKSEQLDEKTLTAENQLAGTVTAMSPEQIQGKTLDTRSDLFSLGSIAFELLCGSRPFEKDAAGALAMANRIANEPHMPPKEAWPAIPEPLAILLDKLLAKDPTQRPEHAQVVYQGLALLHRQGVEAEDEDYTATMTDLFTRHEVKSRRRWQRALAGIAGTLLLGGAGYWSWAYFTRLEPQYIAVMPVEISGEIRGEENAIALTRTMVRQALMNSVSQLKASALVSFTPKTGEDFDSQLQALTDKGVTDALIARLQCAQARCEIELQRIKPKNAQVLNQTSFVFLAENRQESEYRIRNRAQTIFPKNYRKGAISKLVVSDDDYNQLLEILAKTEQKDVAHRDLETLELLIEKYPKNANLYSAYSIISAALFVKTGNTLYISKGMKMLEFARSNNIDEKALLEQEMKLRVHSNDRKKIDALLIKLKKHDSPSANLLAEISRSMLTSGNYEEAQAYANQAVALNPSLENRYLNATIYTATGNYLAARDTLQKIVQTHPKHWSSHSLLGVIELETGNLVAAESAIKAIPERLRNWRTKSNLGVVYFLKNEPNKALDQFQAVLSEIPDDPGTISQIAESYTLIEDQSSALNHYEKLLAITEDDDNFEARQYKALALANLGKESEAIDIINQLLREAPEDTYVQHTAAQVYALSSEARSASYHIEGLLNQGMSAAWFQLPAYQRLCTQPHTSEIVKRSICN
ncbi:protein kinase domain-containing protein [Microbulbifer sp. SA54]|uniref:protein kinase domain-containing protein n=1 Tax=Microbulbifer sp. SA54 TaxID=3401577 RepID=UPI003AAF9BB0